MSPTGTYTFKWVHGAQHDVWVSGDFDDWKKTHKLEKKGDVYEKTVELASQKHLYKFIVDGAWIPDESKPKEFDQNGIANNVLQASDITTSSSATPAISSIGPAATTAAMVGQLPKESTKESSSSVPGSFPETPAAETVSVNPIPASDGVGNPVQLAPGDKVPHPNTLHGNTIGSSVKTDKESYENADAGPASDIVRGAESSVPPVGGSIIPESSLPLGAAATTSPFIQSSGAGTTTAGLVGNLPKEPAGVPEVVHESQEAAHSAPEASANPVAVAEKRQVEDELKSKVPEEPAAAQSGAGGLSTAGIYGTVSGAAAATAAAVTAAVVGTKDKAAETASAATTSAQETYNSATSTSTKATETVPAVVKDSFVKSGESAEAAANPEAVAEKKDVESQLKKEIATTNETGEPAPTITASTTDKAPTSTNKATLATAKPTAATGSAPPKLDGPSDAPATPKKDVGKTADATTPASTSATTSTPTTDKKSKRKSFFLKVKKILHQDK